MAGLLKKFPLPPDVAVGRHAAFGRSEFAVGFRRQCPVLLVATPMRRLFPDGLEAGEMLACRDGFLLILPQSAANAAVLQHCFPHCTPTSGRNRMRLFGPPGDFSKRPELPVFAAAETTVEELTFAAFAAGPAYSYARLQIFDGPDGQPDPFASLWQITHTASAAAASPPAPELSEEYDGQTFLIDGNTIFFPPGAGAALATRCEATLRGICRLNRKLCRLRKNDFEISIAWPTPAEATPAEALFLSRELRKLGVSQFSFVLPERLAPPELARWAAVTQLADGAAGLPTNLPDTAFAGQRLRRLPEPDMTPDF